jgi:hypothetical protein
MTTATIRLWLQRQAREFAIQWDDFCQSVGLTVQAALEAPARCSAGPPPTPVAVVARPTGGLNAASTELIRVAKPTLYVAPLLVG